MKVQIRLQYRCNSRLVQYNKRNHERLVTPVMEKYGAVIIQVLTVITAYTYEVELSKGCMLRFRKELTQQIRRLHGRATYGWLIVN